jgi:hypothetical protein
MISQSLDPMNRNQIEIFVMYFYYIKSWFASLFFLPFGTSLSTLVSLIRQVLNFRILLIYFYVSKEIYAFFFIQYIYLPMSSDFKLFYSEKKES